MNENEPENSYIGKTVYTYTNFDTNPDRNFEERISKQTNINAPYLGKGHERGKVLTKTVFNAYSQLMQEVINTYQVTPVDSLKYVFAINSKKIELAQNSFTPDNYVAEGYAYLIPLDSYDLQSTVDKDYFPAANTDLTPGKFNSTTTTTLIQHSMTKSGILGR